jgi:hypothetical protein
MNMQNGKPPGSILIIMWNLTNIAITFLTISSISRSISGRLNTWRKYFIKARLLQSISEIIESQFSTQHGHTPSNHQSVADLNAEELIRKANKIGSQTTNLIKATLKSRRYTEQAFRTCLGILNLAQKQDTRLLEQACQVVYEIKAFSYQAVKQELNLLYEQVETSEIEKLPTHENVRGAEYYQKRNK